MNKHVDIATLAARPVAGTHGAFTWGVLDRLLEEETIAFEGISATSAGAMNATVMAYGMTVGGREGAKTALRDFWRRISHAALLSPLQPSFFDRLTHNAHCGGLASQSQAVARPFNLPPPDIPGGNVCTHLPAFRSGAGEVSSP